MQACYRTRMASLDRLHQLATRPLRMFLFAVLMPFAISTLLLGLGWVLMSLVISGGPSVSTIPAKAFVLLGVGVVGTVLVARLKRDAGALVRVLRSRPTEVATVNLVRIRVGGLASLVESGQVVFADAQGRMLAQGMVNDTKAFAELRAIIAEHAPQAKVVEQTLENNVPVA